MCRHEDGAVETGGSQARSGRWDRKRAGRHHGGLGRSPTYARKVLRPLTLCLISRSSNCCQNVARSFMKAIWEQEGAVDATLSESRQA
jgi:hypothetical protein